MERGAYAGRLSPAGDKDPRQGAASLTQRQRLFPPIPGEVLVEAESLECLLFPATIRNFGEDEPPVLDDACPVICLKSISRLYLGLIAGRAVDRNRAAFGEMHFGDKPAKSQVGLDR